MDARRSGSEDEGQKRQTAGLEDAITLPSAARPVIKLTL
jgi:hypothetical protein